MTYEEKKTEIANCIMRDAQEIGFDLSSVDVHIVVHHCCIETWLLGNTRFLRRSPSSADFAKWKRRYDVAQYDPEFLETPEEYWTRAQFHYEYLREMFRERNQAYTKNSPGVAKSAHYLSCLVRRCVDTGHMYSFSAFMNSLRQIDPQIDLASLGNVTEDLLVDAVEND